LLVLVEPVVLEVYGAKALLTASSPQTLIQMAVAAVIFTGYVAWAMLVSFPQVDHHPPTTVRP
jgi:hypothetical protein